MKPYRGPPMTLGGAAAAELRLSFGGQHQVEPDPGEMAERYGAATTALRLERPASRCGSHQIDMVATGARRE